MPQLWTETFVTQYFWLLIILFTFYYFILNQVIPRIAESLKSRQLTEEANTKTSEEDEVTNTSALFAPIKQELDAQEKTTWEGVQSEWLSTNPEENELFWAKATISEETEEYIEYGDIAEQSLEDFVKEQN